MTPAPVKHAGNAVTRKVGPLPLWAWAAAVAAIVWLVFLRAPSAGAGTGSTSAAGGSGAQQPASGQGTPADNLNADALAQLLAAQKSSYDALLAALQSTTAGGASGTTGPGYGAPGGSTVDSGSNNAPPSAAAPDGPAASGIASPYTVSDPGGGGWENGGTDQVTYTYTPTQTDSPSYPLGGSVAYSSGTQFVGTSGTVADATGAAIATVDPSGHVVNAKGARVGGFTAET